MFNILNTAEDYVKIEGLKVSMSDWGEPADIVEIRRDTTDYWRYIILFRASQAADQNRPHGWTSQEKNIRHMFIIQRVLVFWCK
jgi:hypothetical protein